MGFQMLRRGIPFGPPYRFDRPDDPLGVAVLFRFADGGHTDLHVALLEHAYVIGRGVLHALIRVMDFWLRFAQSTLQRG